MRNLLESWTNKLLRTGGLIVTNIHLYFLSLIPYLLTVYSHWLSSGPGRGLGRMGCMVLWRTFRTAPEQGQWRIGYIPIFQLLKLFQVVCFNDISVAFRCPVLVPPRYSQRERFLHNIRPCPGPGHGQCNCTKICTRFARTIRISLFNTKPISAPHSHCSLVARRTELRPALVPYWTCICTPSTVRVLEWRISHLVPNRATLFKHRPNSLTLNNE